MPLCYWEDWWLRIPQHQADEALLATATHLAWQEKDGTIIASWREQAMGRIRPSKISETNRARFERDYRNTVGFVQSNAPRA